MTDADSSHESRQKPGGPVGVDGRAYALLLLLAPIVVIIGELLGVLNWLGEVVRRG